MFTRKLCRLRALGCVAIMALSGASAASASGLTILPDAVSYEYFGLNFADNEVRSTSLGTLNYAGQPGCGGTCQATTALGADPSASVTVNEVAYEATGGGVAEAALGYYVEYVNTTPGTYTIDFHTADVLTAPDGAGESANLKFGQAGTYTTQFNNFRTVDLLEVDCANRCPTSSYGLETGPFPTTQALQMIANTPYFVQIEVDLNPGEDNQEISGSIDPTFSDPTSSGSFVYSPGVIGAAVPEPTGWLLMISGFAAVGALARRSRGRSAVLSGAS